eukprot:2298988-Pyramimonas_sp.AAC.1
MQPPRATTINTQKANGQARAYAVTYWRMRAPRPHAALPCGRRRGRPQRGRLRGAADCTTPPPQLQLGSAAACSGGGSRCTPSSPESRGLEKVRRGFYRSSLDARKPQNPTNSEEY